MTPGHPRDRSLESFVAEEVALLKDYPGMSSEDVLKRSRAFRLRIRAIRSYRSAYPESTWPRYPVVIGSSLVTGGIGLWLSLGHPSLWSLSGLSASFPAVSIFGFGAFVVSYGLVVMRDNQRKRERHFAEGRRLFQVWAEAVHEPWRVALEPELESPAAHSSGDRTA